jgi:hypothetical protein
MVRTRLPTPVSVPVMEKFVSIPENKGAFHSSFQLTATLIHRQQSLRHHSNLRRQFPKLPADGENGLHGVRDAGGLSPEMAANFYSASRPGLF